MKKVLCTLIGVLFLSGIIFAQTDPNHPNILLIIADDLGIDAINGYQNSSLLPSTPNLDSLRMKGLTFKNAWATPKCSPTRAAIMTGKYGNKNGVLDTPGDLEPTHTSIFEAIEAQTGGVYADAVIGKWHISNPADINHPNQLGVDYYEGFFDGNINDYYNWTRTFEGNTTPITEYATSYLTNSAINWIDNQNQPWFLWLAHAAPHSPYVVPPAGTYAQSPTNTNRHKFIAMIENLDYETGRLLASLSPAVRDNTIIIFLGDNGTSANVVQNFPGNQSKGTVYQGGAAVPMFMAGPGISRINEEEQGLVHVMDVYATFLDILGANLPGGIYNSQSFYESLSTPNLPRRPYNYTEIGNPPDDDFTIRDNQYKLLQFEDGTQEFYDLIADPLEGTNLLSSLDADQEAIKLELENEAYAIRTSWSCKDQIQNGEETSIDCGASNCFGCELLGGLDCEIYLLETCGDVQADTSIIAENYVASEHKFTSQNARLWAGNYVELRAGFEFTGDDLEVEINVCNITGADDTECPNLNVTSQTNTGCCATPAVASQYTETIASDVRTIMSNNFPNHDYCYTNNNIPSPIPQTFSVDATPALASTATSILNGANRPIYFFGVAANGVKIDPAPAQPFIFTDTITGEYNWDWVYELTNVQGIGQGFVRLDCASGHTGSQGYHYHGNMFQYIEEIIQPGLSTTTTPPASPALIGWAADGYPIVYRFGPDGVGGLVLLQPGYRLKYGNRPGDGASAPCGSYSGRYTRDYEYDPCAGDLDECNGIQRSITLTTPQGMETFDYFYVITGEFPQISRCLSGTPNPSFRN